MFTLSSKLSHLWKQKTKNFLILKINNLGIKSNWLGDFPGGAVVKNPPANAGDMGSIPGPGGSHMPPFATTTEARAPRARAPQQEKPPQWEARAPQQRVAPARLN